ncbi:MAG TPA: HAD-IIIA family hydrolase [Candidatus Binatia bacterium]|jgi:histidinol-phosphate phosphatase family protein|nr:HAD-IIIA family hydrolase [Candidatus Binatia bacterium]
MEINPPSATVGRSLELSSVTAAVLAGGLGTRLRSKVADRPKVLAPVGARPFLAYLLDQLAAADCRSVVLCTGYRGEQILSTFGENYRHLRLIYSQEQEPMGTGGALRLALARIESDPVLVMNGDSYCDIDLKTYWEWHCRQNAAASMALTRVVSTERFGRVKLDADAQVVAFSEKKEGGGPGWINAGVYCINQEVLRSIPERTRSSLEQDVFPRWVGRGLYGYSTLGSFIDIGTPEDFGAAENFLAGTNETTPRRFIVLDRDGTIIEEREYLSEPEQVKLIPGAGPALRQLREMGFGLVVITNQSGVGRGLFDATQLRRIHDRLDQLLEAEGVHLDAVYICPHKPDDDCLCRKPRLGLMEKAAGELGFIPQNSIVIGDKACDIDMGRMAGALTFLVRTGYGAQIENTVEADFVVDDLSVATRSIGRLLGRERTVIHGH